MSYEDLGPAILEVLPVKGVVTSIARHGKTRWSIGLRVEVEADEGKKNAYFVKAIGRSEWTPMAIAECEAQSALAAIIPDNVVMPVAWGEFEKGDNSKIAFFMTRFRKLLDEPPLPLHLVRVLKKLHQTSESPTGKFGFHRTTYWGPGPMVNDWTDSWEEYYARQFRSDISYAQNALVKDPELAELTEVFIEKVVARLLRPLQTGGRSIKPSLCNGDIWDGNVQVDADNKEPVIFDSCAFYGHNEIDLQAVGGPRYVLGNDFVDMYAIDIVVAAICLEQSKLIEKLVRQTMHHLCHLLIESRSKVNMRRLLDKFPDGYAGFQDDGAYKPAL